MGDWEAPLGELRFHWGEAYIIEYFRGPDLWLAQRRDNGTTLKAATAARLHDLIAADYTARPVPRQGDGR